MNAKRKPVLLHADWSIKPEARALAIAVPKGEGWRIEHLVQPVRDEWLLKFVADLPRPTVLAMDLPLGVPEAYLEKLWLDSFLDLLAKLDEPAFAAFAEPATAFAEISVHRPFYPAAAGGTRQEDLVQGLGLDNAHALRRRCEGQTSLRTAAAPVFWTIGPQQVGRAALAAWYGVVRPALRDLGAAIWPYAGELDDLVAGGRLVLAESYPSDVRRRLAPENGDATIANPENRAAILGEALSGFINVEMAQGLWDEAEEGFASRDAFDAFIGLLGMIRSAERGWLPEPPRGAWLAMEGWILGLPPEELRVKPDY